MDKQHPCIAWVPNLWDRCRNLCTRNKKRSKDCVQAIEEKGPVDPAEDIFYQVITNTIPPAKDWVRTQAQIPAIEKVRPLPDLPLDIIVTDIFTRLPARCIFQLWQQINSNDVLYDYFTMNSHFTRTHLERGSRATNATIVIQSLTQSVGNVIKLFLSEDGRGNSVTSLDLIDSPYNCKGPFPEVEVTLLGSCDGFLLFRCMHYYSEFLCIWNPITKEQVILAPNRPFTPFRVCGFYYHPLKKEYEVVCVRMSWTEPITWGFHIFSLRTKSTRSVGTYYYGPSWRKQASVFINGTFYWLVDLSWHHWNNRVVFPSLSNSIMSFNIETEEFGIVQMPISNVVALPIWKWLEQVFHLFEMEGHLCLFDSLSNKNMAYIWEFNYDTRRWVIKYSMAPPKSGYWDLLSGIEYIKMTGELITYVSRKRNATSYVYNPRSCRWKPFENKGFEGDNFTVTTGHINSLETLDAGDSVISIEW